MASSSNNFDILLLFANAIMVGCQFISDFNLMSQQQPQTSGGLQLILTPRAVERLSQLTLQGAIELAQITSAEPSTSQGSLYQIVVKDLKLTQSTQPDYASLVVAKLDSEELITAINSQFEATASYSINLLPAFGLLSIRQVVEGTINFRCSDAKLQILPRIVLSVSPEVGQFVAVKTFAHVLEFSSELPGANPLAAFLKATIEDSVKTTINAHLKGALNDAAEAATTYFKNTEFGRLSLDGNATVDFTLMPQRNVVQRTNDWRVFIVLEPKAEFSHENSKAPHSATGTESSLTPGAEAMDDSDMHIIACDHFLSNFAWAYHESGNLNSARVTSNTAPVFNISSGAVGINWFASIDNTNYTITARLSDIKLQNFKITAAIESVQLKPHLTAADDINEIAKEALTQMLTAPRGIPIPKLPETAPVQTAAAAVTENCIRITVNIFED